MGGYAWVTLATNNSYSLGALVLAHSLKKANTAHNLAILITPAVSESMREQLQTVFDVVKVVDVLDSKDEAHLALMKRPDLGITFTKIHCWRLVEFEKCVFLDADTLVVRNCDELFEREEFSAAPDVSWPDCFNSGVFVYRPSVETFNKLLQFAVENRSFDGGDQGLLNQYFSDWATEDIKKHLPFVYNLTSVAVYSYIPAFKHYGSETRIVHFIGNGKPWLQPVDASTRTVSPTSGSEHLTPLFQQWWDLFCEKVHPNLDKNLESSNNGMSHSYVEACSNPLPIALIDESHTPRLIEPCTPYREKDDFRQYNLPYQPFDVKGSSGELLNEEFLLASVVSPTAQEVSLDKQQRQDEDKMEEKSENDWRVEEIKKADEVLTSNIPVHQENYTVKELEKADEEKKADEQKKTDEQKKADEQKKVEDEIRDLEQYQKPEDPPPPKNPFEYSSFFPDDTCINNYLERNVKTYQPFDNHHHHHFHHYKETDHKQYQPLLERNNESDNSNDNQKVEQNISFLPRFLTLPEDDRRQSGNTETHSSGRDSQNENKVLSEDFPTERYKQPLKKSIPSRDDTQTEPIAEKRELTKSKSMSYLPYDVTIVEPSPPPSRSIWKSQPDVNVDFNRKYSMPKLKPILPKQNSFSKSIPPPMPKVTQYTEFLMSSEYKDPIDLPKDKVGFVEMHIHKEANLKRSKSDVDIRSKFGPLPYALSPEAEEPVIPKKIPFWHLENELYDLTQCKRQLGNKPKPKGTDQGKENIRSLPALKPIVPDKEIKSTVVKKRKSKKLVPGDEGREKILKQDPEAIRGRKRVTKSIPRNVSMNTNRNNLDEILNRLREFSKNYQHFFGVVTETNKKAVKCKNVSVQASEQNGDECTSSEIFKTFSTPVIMSSKRSQTGEEIACESAIESSEFRQFRNYVKDQSEASQKGLLSLQEILSGTVKEKRKGLKFSSAEDGKKDMESGSDSLMEIINNTENKNEASKLAKEYNSLKATDAFIHSRKEYSNYQSSSKLNEKECNSKTQIKPFMLKHIESSTSTNIIPNLTDCNGNSYGSKTVHLLHRTKDNSLNLSELHETNGIIEKKVQSHSKSYNITPSFTYKIKNSAQSNETVSKYFEERKEHESNIRKEANMHLGSKISKECNKNSKRNFLKKFTENQKIPNNGQAVVGHSNECQSLVESEASVAASEVLPSRNSTKSKSVIEAELRQQDVSGPKQPKQESEGQSCTSNARCNVKFTKFITHSKNEEMDRESSGPVLEQKDGESAKAEVSIRNNNQSDYDSSRSLNTKATLQKEQRSHVAARGNEKTNEESKKVKDDDKSKQEDDSKSFSFGATEEKITKDYKKAKGTFCATYFNTPSSSCATLSAAKVTASDLVEEMITKAVCECADQSRSSASPSSSRSTPQKVRKPRSRPKKVCENGIKNENRFEIPSIDSPDGSTRFIARKTYDKKSKRKIHLLSGSDPRSGNAQPENVEDPKSTSGIAGAIAQLNLESGSGQSPESITASTAHQEYLRRQNWETGNMDYMGRDSFDNIWSKICQTIEAKESEEPVAESPKPPGDTSIITEEAEKFKEVALAESTVTLSSVLQKCPEYIETLPGEPAVGPVEDDKIFFSKPESKQSCLTNLAEEEEDEIEGSARRAPLSVAEKVKLSDILHPGLSFDDAKNTQTESSNSCEKNQDLMTNLKASGEEKSQKKEEKAEKVQPCEESKNTPETLANILKSTEPLVSSSEEKPQPTALPTEIKSQFLSLEKPECKTVAICQPPIPLPQTPSSGLQKPPETLVRAAKLEEKAEECKVVAIPSPPVVIPGAPFTEKEKKQFKTENVEKKSDVKSEPIPLPPPDSPVVVPSQELDVQISKSDSLKDENKQKKGVFTKILEMVGVASKEKNGSEISKSVFYDTEGNSFFKEVGTDNQASITRENKKLSDVQSSAEKIEIAQSAGDIEVIEEATKPEAKKAEQEKAVPPVVSHISKDLFSLEAEEEKSKIIPHLKKAGVTEETKLQELKHSDKTQEQKLLAKETEKPSAIDVKSKNQSKKQKSAQAKLARNSSPKELKTQADSSQTSVAKRKSSSPKLTMPQNPPETEITMPTPPPHPEISPRRNSALLKVDDSILETPPVPEPLKESADEVVKEKTLKKIDIMEKAKSEVENLLQDCRSVEIKAEENSDLINTMKLLLAGEPSMKAAQEDVEELRVTSEEERKQHKGEVVSSKLSDQILKAIPPPRRKAISEASASTSAIPKASPASEQKNPSAESRAKTSKSSSIPVPPPRSKGKPTQPAPSKGKGKK